MILQISVDSLAALTVRIPTHTNLTVVGTPGSTGPPGPTGPTGNTGAAGSTDSVHVNVNQSAHGFSVGNVLRVQNATATYIKAQADTAANAEVVGIVSSVTDSNNFVLVMFGYVTGLSGLTKGTIYFLSDVTAGLLTATEPTPNGVKVSKPLLVANGTTTGFFTNERGFIKGA